MSLRNETPGLFEPSEEELRSAFRNPDLSGASSRGGQVAGMICHGIGLATFCVGFSPILVGLFVGGDSGDWGAIAAKMGSLFVLLICSLVALVFHFIGRKLYGRRLIVSIPQLRDRRIRAMMLWGDWLGAIVVIGSLIAIIVGAVVFLLSRFASSM